MACGTPELILLLIKCYIAVLPAPKLCRDVPLALHALPQPPLALSRCTHPSNPMQRSSLHQTFPALSDHIRVCQKFYKSLGTCKVTSSFAIGYGLWAFDSCLSFSLIFSLYWDCIWFFIPCSMPSIWNDTEHIMCTHLTTNHWTNECPDNDLLTAEGVQTQIEPLLCVF